MSSDTEEHFSVKKRVSKVWTYFDKINQQRVRCRICEHEQNYQGTTGNLLRHLKSKHKIDATVKLPNEMSTFLKIKSEDMNNKETGNEKDVRMTTRSAKEAKINLRSNSDELNDNDNIDPYPETAIIFEGYIESNETNNDVKKKLDFMEQNKIDDKNVKYTIEEKRVQAEIEYFREKAAFYRMQKNLAALKAKKIKYELEQYN
ncbi:uncharacterized protein LOC119680951 [Teleopsis dalmanni]|uniref:uncharacterized protein LOC119680951 n=1 Tax=Teleopsis dalmanni TaxID=139649 RepID=UPI0018CD9C7C|nr:uncharacterized protein LOC119680951 [Teleopsis dalmanni]